MNGFYQFLSGLGYSHPIHPTQINMPIGLAIGAFILGIAAVIRSDAAVGAKQMVLLAFLFIFPTVAAGFLDWWHFYGGAWVYPFGIKVGLGILLLVLLLAALLLGRRGKGISVAFLGVMLLAFVDAVALGYFGGEVVFGQQAPDAPEHRVGETVFRYNCSGCHPFGGNHIAPRHPVIGAHVIGNPESLTAWIRSPAPPMPAFPPARISDDRARELSAYFGAVWGKGQERGEGQEGHGHGDMGGGGHQ
ncbi:MAG: hypothetical protein C4519_08215 [Desulfobacteraceae bacterium]|nr:MAG: hypothetical protein C4519_08215 [Desulfobacteraceae bacterium]